MYKLFSALVVAVLALGVAGNVLAADAKKPADKKAPTKTPEERFAAADKDKDGSVSKDEFMGKAKPEQKEVMEKRFKMLDKNGDGKLSKEEYCAPPPAKKGAKKAEKK